MNVTQLLKVNTLKEINILERNLKVLYILNILDLIFTKTLLYCAPNIFMEANIFMEPIINSYIAYMLKIFLFGAVLFYWYKRSLRSNKKQLMLSIKVSKICVFGYLIINIMHIIYFFMIIFLKI